MPRFFAKLCLFLAPFVAVFSLPAFVLGVSGEVLSADEIARRHYQGDRSAIYGPGYTNPDARYKLASIRLHRPKVLAIGSSRALALRADLFTGGDRVFYNAGLLTERLYELRRALAHLPTEGCNELILVLDQWSFNANWPNAVDNPLYERELSSGGSDVLNSLQHGARLIWSDLLSGHLALGPVMRGGANLGVMARVRGDGFRWDGSYAYAEILRAPAAAADYQFKDTLGRVAAGTKRFERADGVDDDALGEVRMLVDAARQRGAKVIVYLPPFAPVIARALAASEGHRYMTQIATAVRPIVENAGYAFFDFTSCEPLGCVDAEFIDGMHPGSKGAARLLIEMAKAVPWLDARVDQAELTARIARSAGGPELDFPEHP